MLPLDFILFLQIIIFLFITPGTPRIVIVSYSMNYGVQKCVWTALGDITANFIQATLVIFVLGTFFSDNPTFLNIIKWIGVIFLLYLAYDVYKSSPKEINSEIVTSKSFFSFFIDFNSNYVVQFFILITTYVVLDLLSLIGYALLAQKLITWIKANPKTINTISASVLIIIAFIIIITQQY